MASMAPDGAWRDDEIDDGSVDREILFETFRYGTTIPDTSIFDTGVDFKTHRCHVVSFNTFKRVFDGNWVDMALLEFNDCRFSAMPTNNLIYAHHISSLAHADRYKIAARTSAQFFGYCDLEPVLTPKAFLTPLFTEFFANFAVPRSKIYQTRLDGSVQIVTIADCVTNTITDMAELVKRWNPVPFKENECSLYIGVNVRECSDQEDSSTDADIDEDENDLVELTGDEAAEDAAHLLEIKRQQVHDAPRVKKPVVKPANPDPTSFPPEPIAKGPMPEPIAKGPMPDEGATAAPAVAAAVAAPPSSPTSEPSSPPPKRSARAVPPSKAASVPVPSKAASVPVPSKAAPVPADSLPRKAGQTNNAQNAGRSSTNNTKDASIGPKQSSSDKDAAASSSGNRASRSGTASSEPPKSATASSKPPKSAAASPAPSPAPSKSHKKKSTTADAGGANAPLAYTTPMRTRFHPAAAGPKGTTKEVTQDKTPAVPADTLKRTRDSSLETTKDIHQGPHGVGSSKDVRQGPHGVGSSKARK
ncbi:hypothetical protein T484DRAFT_1862083 [Baffinella frigidus]|nr:hypothetical protein T484DRAFT_1862083 [Cryptophyta sp. CCMP2293]